MPTDRLVREYARATVPARVTRLWLAAMICAGTHGARAADADEGVFTVRSMTPETAWAAAQAAVQHCRTRGWQVTAAVVDRSGLLQVLLRDRFAGPHTPEVATAKAWTAASTRTATTDFAAETQAGRPMSGLRGHPRFMAVGGGLPIAGGGSALGAIGVSGAPGGEADDECARAGVRAIADRIEF
jgi:uncharacterized protein GlcG (DUF336 family)